MSKLDKFRKAIAKKDEFNIGFSPIPEYICTGNMGLNYIITGNPRMGLPVARSTMVSGLSGTGKSFLTANIMKNAQQKGYFCIVLDTENSLGDSFMEKIGVDTSEEAFMPVSVYSVEETISFFSELFKNTEKEDKICVIVDSLSNLETEKDLTKFDDGNVAYGQGLKEKLYKQLVRNVNSKIGNRNMIVVFNTHVYVSSTDAYGNPILKPSCGSSTLFIPSVGIELSKSDLKEGKEQVGITIKAKTYKTRYTSLGLKTQFDLPWDRGMDLYEGLLPILEASGIVGRAGAWYAYDVDGESVKFQRKNLHEHVDALLDLYEKIEGKAEIVEKDEDADIVDEE